MGRADQPGAPPCLLLKFGECLSELVEGGGDGGEMIGDGAIRVLRILRVDTNLLQLWGGCSVAKGWPSYRDFNDGRTVRLPLG